MTLDELNAEQRAAATAPDGPVMIVAGPGTGKTKTLAARAAWLLSSGVRPSEILALTFTRKAAAEMRSRVDGLVGSGAAMPRPEITTFHALGVRVLGDDGRAFVSNDERLAVLAELRRPTAFKGVSARALSLALSRASYVTEPPAELAELAARYDEALAARGQRDFDGVLRDLYDRVRANPSSTARKYVLVDEFQDTNELQYELVKLLAGSGGLFVIGDSRQSIYGFRGANGDVFDRFERDFPEAQNVCLRVNYRSARDIVAVGNAVFSEGAALEPAQSAAGRVRLMEMLDEYREADWIVGQIETGVGGTGFNEASADEPVASSFRDFAVVYRTHRAAGELIRRLNESGLPFQVAGEGSPYERPEMQGVVRALERLGSDAADGWLERELVAQVGTVAVPELVQRIAAQIGGFDDEARRRELAQLASITARFGSDAVAAGRYFADLREAEYYDPLAEAITLATIHAAKGLEFEHVFVLGAEDGLLPHMRPALATDIDEERRLFYVAMTRAKQRLDITWARRRGGQSAGLSRFAGALPVARQADPDLASQEHKRRINRIKRSQGQLF